MIIDMQCLQIPDLFTGIVLPAGPFALFTVHTEMPHGLIVDLQGPFDLIDVLRQKRHGDRP